MASPSAWVVALVLCLCCGGAVGGGEKGPSGNSIAVTEKAIVGEVLDMIWVGEDERTVFILTDKNVVYRSTDQGKTWVNQRPRLEQGGASEGVIAMEVSAADKSRIILLSDAKVHWCTTDAGKTYKVINNNLRFHEVRMHPQRAELVMASVLSPKCHDSSAEGFCYKNLYVSHDFGTTWKFLTHYVVQFDWAHNLQRGQADHLPTDAVFATEFHQKQGNQRFGYWDERINFVVSSDFWKTPPKVVVERGNRFLFTAKFLFVATVHEHKKDEVTLGISSDGGKSWQPATLPFGELRQHSYTILDTSEDTVFLHVNHVGESSSWGNVYISDAMGLGYSLSLPHNRRATNGKCDFEKIEGLEGIYLANYIDNVDYQADTEQWYNDMGQETARQKKTEKVDVVRTVISFDKGAVWSYLRPPRYDANGQPMRCDDVDCSLHLHGITSEWGPFYTSENAMGLIMATGNVGHRLSNYGDEINTYFSRDAGLVWYEVAKGSHIYEFGDHGALVVMADDQQATTKLLYSWNEGISWNEFQFTSTPMEVVNIIIEPSATAQQFIVYGARWSKSGEVTGAVVHVDFGELHQTRCKGADTPGEPDSDFEKWSPHDGRIGDQCLLGHKVWYTRRKRDKQCFNGEVLERKHDVHHCECDELDYECDANYARKVEGGPCIAVKPVNISALIPADCPSGSTYPVSNGYRKVAGDSCVGGVDHDAQVFHCPHWTHHVSHGGWAVMFVVMFLVVSLGAVTWLQRGANPYSGGSSMAHGGAKMQGLKGFLFGLWETVKELAGRRQHVAYAGIGEQEIDSAVAYNSDMYDDDGGGDFDLVGDDDNDAEPEVMNQEDISKMTARRYDGVDVSKIPTIRGPSASTGANGVSSSGIPDLFSEPDDPFSEDP